MLLRLPGAPGSAPARAERGGGAAAWVEEGRAAPGTQGSRQPRGTGDTALWEISANLCSAAPVRSQRGGGPVQRQACRGARGQDAGAGQVSYQAWPPGRPFSIARPSRHSDGTPGPGPSFPIAQTSGTGYQPLCGPLLASRRRRPRGQRKTAVKARPGSGLAASPGLHAVRPSSEGIPLPQVCSGHLPTVHSRSCPGIALQTQAPAPAAAAAHCRGRASLPRYVVLRAGRSEDCRG